MSRSKSDDDKVSEAIRARDDFFDAVAHELRTPLAALRLQLALLLDSHRASTEAALPEQVRTRLIAMRRQVDHLERISARFTDVMELEHTDVPLALARVDLNAIIASTTARLEEQLRWAGCPLSIVAPSAPVEIVADGTRLDEAVSNLLMNASKYAPGQPIDVHVDANDARATICIVDRGPGIAPAMKHVIFEKFMRGAQHDRRAPGLGLGLWISKRIV